MYHNSSSKVCVENYFCDSFSVNVGVHQGSVLSRLLFIMVLEALSQEFRTEYPKELLNADYLVINTELVEVLCKSI